MTTTWLRVAAVKVSQLVGSEVSDKIPEGESKPQADILVILGKE